MKVNHKFDIGNMVWVMENNRPVRMEVRCVEITIESMMGIYSVEYSFEYNGRKYSEDKVFGTKEELIESL